MADAAKFEQRRGKFTRGRRSSSGRRRAAVCLGNPALLREQMLTLWRHPASSRNTLEFEIARAWVKDLKTEIAKAISSRPGGRWRKKTSFLRKQSIECFTDGHAVLLLTASCLACANLPMMRRQSPLFMSATLHKRL